MAPASRNMNKIVFITTSFDKKQFTTAWSYLSDRDGQPCNGKITLFDNRVECESQETSFALNALLEVSGFGKVVLQTEVVNAKKQTVDLLDSLIQGRVDQINQKLRKIDQVDVFTSELQHIQILKTGKSKLLKLMFFGEKLAFETAKHRLTQRIASGETQNILFGSQAFGIQKGDRYRSMHQKTFNLSVAPLYFFLLKGKSPREIDWRLTDEVVDWLSSTRRVVKGHPLVWLHKYALPAWMINLTFNELKEFLNEHITQVVNRYKDKIKMWDIVNEMPTADANGFDLTIDQLLEILRLTSDLVKKLQPEAERIVNFSDIWAAGSFVQERPSIPPVHFLKMCLKRNIEFESIGLQFYMGMKKEFTCRDLLNISQATDEFLQFDKPIHFSELGWPSVHDVDPDCFFSSDHPEAGGWWHRMWDEKLQAEFLEKILTIFLSKPRAKSITWWDFTDNGTNSDIGSRFLPFGGLTRRDFSPKPAWITLQKFREKLNHRGE